MPRRPDPLAMTAANVEACPALDTLLILSRYAAEGGTAREWSSPFCHATSWEITFANDLAEKVRRWTLSEKQQALVTKIANGLAERAGRRSEEIAAAKPIATGRGEVDGTVLTIKEQSFYAGYGRSTTTLKMLVQCDGYKLWGTVPSAIAEQVQRGDRVVFTATVTEKERGFGLFSRPAGGVCMAVASA
jgi:hypothetical protein